MKNRITFKMKTGCSFELLMPETVKSKITKDKNGENVHHLEITEVVLVYCNIVSNDYQKDSRANLFIIIHLVNNQIFQAKVLYF